MHTGTIYLDHAATTPLDERVLEAMLPYLREHFGNASSVHQLGRKARYAVESSRERVAACLGAEPSEIVFTSGGTEADNLALFGLLQNTDKSLLTATVEHKAVLNSAGRLDSLGNRVRFLSPSATGAVSPDALREALSDDVGLVSLMYVNNEVGALNDLPGLCEICHGAGALFHSDAVQALGLLPVRVDRLPVDALSISGHKIYGPKGVGALFLRGGVHLEPVVVGGAQERGRRAGTENVAAIVGMATAVELAFSEQAHRLEHIGSLRTRLVEQLVKHLGDHLIFNTSLAEDEAAPHIMNVSFPPYEGRVIDGEMLHLNLDMEGVCVSAGSACTSGAMEPSHVLLAMGLPPQTAAASIRFSMGKYNSLDDIDVAVAALVRVIDRMLNHPRASVPAHGNAGIDE